MKLYFLLTCVCFNLLGIAQENNSEYDFNKIQLTVAIPPEVRTSFDEESVSFLETKLINMVLGSGFGSSSNNPHFIIWPRITVINKEITPTAPVMIIQELEINLLVGDYLNGTMVHRKTFTIKGVGNNETKSMIDALKKIKPEGKDFKSFTEESRKKIIQYYENSCNDYIAKANGLIHQKKYDEAIAVCMEVPLEVSACYSKIEEKAFEAYKLYSNQNCMDYMLKAKAAKATNNFGDAVYYLGLIDPTSVCAKDAEQLIKDIEIKLTEKEKREWEFMLQQYKDDIVLKKLRIRNSKEIALKTYRILVPGQLINLFSIFR